MHVPCHAGITQARPLDVYRIATSDFCTPSRLDDCIGRAAWATAAESDLNALGERFVLLSEPQGHRSRFVEGTSPNGKNANGESFDVKSLGAT